MAIYTDYVAAAIMYNLQILPESILCGLILLAIVLANQPLVILAAALAGVQLLASTVGTLLMRFSPEQAVVSSSMTQCTMGYIGKSWDRLFRGGADLLWHPKAPSIYMVTVGFLAGWGYALQQLYKEEIQAGVLKPSMMTTMAIITLLTLLLAAVFRIGTGCDSFTATLGGLAFGLLLGYTGAIALGYATDRRATNLWGIPLLRDRINQGSAVYICPT
jgi:hypothetical protein